MGVKVNSLKETCKAIIDGYAAEKTMFDDDMVGHVQDLADATDEILLLLERLDKLELENARLNGRAWELNDQQAQARAELNKEI